MRLKQNHNGAKKGDSGEVVILGDVHGEDGTAKKGDARESRTNPDESEERNETKCN